MRLELESKEAPRSRARDPPLREQLERLLDALRRLPQDRQQPCRDDHDADRRRPQLSQREALERDLADRIRVVAGHDVQDVVSLARARDGPSQLVRRSQRRVEVDPQPSRPHVERERMAKRPLRERREPLELRYRAQPPRVAEPPHVGLLEEP